MADAPLRNTYRAPPARLSLDETTELHYHEFYHDFPGYLD